jgi:predicted ATPase
MAKELAHFKNFAKLKDTSIAFNDITVLAGKPSTGKSYVMKFMYAINEMLFQKFRGKLIDSNQDLTNLFFNIEANYAVNPDIGYLYNLFNLDKYEELYNDINKNLNFIYRELTLNSLENIMNKEKLSIEKKIEFYLNNLLKSIFTNQSQISNSYSVTYSNIQFNYENQDFNVKLEQEVFKLVNETIFVETPLILEFKKFMNREKGKTPYHIESLLKILDTDYSFTDIEQDKFIKDFTAKSKEIIQENIESSGDSFLFKTDRGNYDIINTSSGTKSIGLLQYLVTNKALKKGSVLYWEEPEVHLHPKWQLKMIELFIELMNAGVKIVFSTHSHFMADSLNALSKKGKFEERISFNLLQENNGIVENHILDSDEKWQMIQNELLGSLEDIMWQYL